MSNEILVRHGVLGMKWGVRKSNGKEPLGSKIKKTAKAYHEGNKLAAKERREVFTKEGRSKRTTKALSATKTAAKGIFNELAINVGRVGLSLVADGESFASKMMSGMANSALNSLSIINAFEMGNDFIYDITTK